MAKTEPRRAVTGTTANATRNNPDAQLHLQRDLRLAWKNREFTLAYQPQFNLLTHQIVAFEALLRWSSAERGHVGPTKFLPILEQMGLAIEVGEWVLQTACHDATRWPDPIGVAVNICAIQLQDAALPAAVSAALAQSGLSSSRLELEITESSVMPADARSLAALLSIRGTGVRIVIDDFDVGYSALGYLVKFPFDKIKIDRFFTTRLRSGGDGHDTPHAIFRAIIGMCKELNIVALAEGIETREQLMIVRDLHCIEIQGYLSGHPLPATQIADTLANGPRLLLEMTGAGATEARASHALWSESVPFFKIAEALNDIVIVTTPDLTPPGPSIVYVNPAFTRLSGYSAAEAIGQTPRLLQGPGTSRQTLDKIRAGLQTGAPVHEKILNFGKSGAPYWLDLQIVPLRDDAGAITHFAAIERDVTLDKRRLDELEYLADRDTLTGIPNRRAFLRGISAEVDSATADGFRIADVKWPCMVFVDVDHFKKINDEFGHPVGDAVLCGIADCLAENVRRIDMLGRVGGEEFAVCMPAITLRDAKALAERLRCAVAATSLATPVGPLKVTVSIGVASFTPGDSVDALTSRADTAMYAAKRAGGNRVRATA